MYDRTKLPLNVGDQIWVNMPMRIINKIWPILLLLREAIGLAGDSGDEPFTDEEYDAMYEFLDRQEEIVRHLDQQLYII